MAQDTNEFLPRPYQAELCEAAMKGNTIIYLPTGAGKTFIAVMVIRQMSADLQKSYSQGGKHTIFAVRTVPLVIQQSRYIERLTGLSCGAYTGDMNVDYWKQEEWTRELEKNQVLVMTAQILLNNLTCGFMKLNRINLIIFDECHGAVSDDPMRQVMKLFSFCPTNQQPKVIGLTGSLLNCNVKVHEVKSTIESLEVTFHAKIATISSWDSLRSFFASPKESIIFFEPSPLSNVLGKVLGILSNAESIVTCINVEMGMEVDQSSHQFRPRSMNSKLASLIRNVTEQLETGGLSAGNHCILLYLIHLETYKKKCTQVTELHIIEYISTELMTGRMLLEREMEDTPECSRILKFATDKIRKLCLILKEAYDTQTESCKFCCMIFVKQKMTAKVLYHILKALHNQNNDYKFLLPEFIIGNTVQALQDTREGMCISKWNKEALQRFRNGISNCIVATNIIDEGIDIPDCSLIIRYDPPLDVRSYIQSKGRARHKESRFILLAPNDPKFLIKLKNYSTVESYLKDYLTKNHKQRCEPASETIEEELYASTIEPYIITSSNGTTTVLTSVMAISIINNYCMCLLSSKFVKLAPIWQLHKIGETEYKVSLKLPIVSAYKETIMGDPMESIKLAKRSVAMKMCIKLYELGELTDNLQPCPNESILHNVDYLYPHWKEEDSMEWDSNAKNKQTHALEFPKAMYSAFPIKDKILYLHVLHMKPVYSVPHDNASLVFYNLLANNAGYAILSAKEMPQVPSFPIFMSVGELSVDVQVNYKQLTLTQADIDKLVGFHSLVFEKICRIMKSFMVFDTYNLDNCYLVAPVDEKWDINWDVVNQYKSIQQVVPTTPFEFRSTDYELAVVIPNYRGSNEVYVTTQVCDDLTPQSCFPTDDYSSFATYYEVKHGIKIKDLSQPMLEVKPLSNKINCIKPRDMTKLGLGKRKRADLIKSGFMEHLVPELCIRILFPSLYWSKGTALPSVLHRISQLLVADDLRRLIVQETGMGELDLPAGKSWPPLKPMENNGIIDEGEPVQESLTDETLDCSQDISNLCAPEVDILTDETNHYPWQKEDEPLDLVRNADRVQVIDIVNFSKFMSEPCHTEQINRHVHFEANPEVTAPDLLILSTSNKYGPDPVEVMYALTAKASNDMFNLERLETLGDSYLKFIASLYLYSSFATSAEGALTIVKGKMVGNTNLYYAGCAKKLPGRIKIDEFSPDTFIPPAFSTFLPIQEKLIKDGKSPSVLYELDIPREEQFTGCLSIVTMEKILNIMANWNDSESPTGMEHYIKMQNVGGKNVADCVEALTGVYLRSMGIRGAAKLLSWFEVIPGNVNVDHLLNVIVKHPTATMVDHHMPWAPTMERKLGYKFNNRAYLLQALTHPSYMAPGISESYQRLEFLGDAILDLLITAYIYENCGNLTPGELTDLRSALVNNITFACLATRYGFHTGLLGLEPQLSKMIDRFVTFQEGRGHIVDDTLLSVLLEEDNCNLAEYVDVPKALGDIFESIVGAIYLDSGKDLRKVWKIVYSLMHKEIDIYSNDVPKNPIRKLFETAGTQPVFRNATVNQDSGVCMVPLQVTIAGKVKQFYGFGCNKKLAKLAAAKQALKSIVYS